MSVPRSAPMNLALALTAALLVCCSCQTPMQHVAGGAPTGAAPGLPPEAFAEMSGGPSGMEAGAPLPYQPSGPRAPPGMAGPWPRDEYLRDGGVAKPPVQVGRNWDVHGLGMEDTVAHYDTLDGQRVVEPSNAVYLYAPRFGAVRQVTNIVETDQADRSAGIHLPSTLVTYGETDKPTATKQNTQARRDVGTTVANTFRSRQGEVVTSNAMGLTGFHAGFAHFENISVIRQGTMVEAEMATLAKGTNAARAWSHDETLSVVLDKQGAAAETQNERMESVYTIKRPPGHPKLRVFKVASTQLAQPGDTVDFTIRYDNVGDETIGNVTILDNLSTRLELIPKSAQSSVDAKFSTQPNENGSLVLRWEITPAVEVGKGGVVRFSCRVR